MNQRPEDSIINQDNDGMQAGDVQLDPKHPGLHDPEYVARRTHFFRTCRRRRLSGNGVPVFDYTPEEQTVWRAALQRLNEAHDRFACKVYLQARKALHITSQVVPQVTEVSAKLHAINGFRLAPAEGLLPPGDFFGFLRRRMFACTQYLRHGSDPSFTPEPDMIHDLLGHVPLLIDNEYASLMELMGLAGALADPEQLVALTRLYWFGVEFGLILQDGVLKVFGAGLLSSYGEMQHALSPEVQRRPFTLDEVIQTGFDPSAMQELLFVIPSFAFLRAETQRFVQRLQRHMKCDRATCSNYGSSSGTS